MGKSLNGA